jgi:hypothetical protein
MKNTHWITLGIAHVFLYVVLGVYFAPNLNTGLALDAYKYITALAWFSASPIIFYWYISREHAKQLNKTSYGLNVGTLILLGALLLIALIFNIYRLDLFDFQDFCVANSVVCFFVILIFSGLNRVSDISNEITSNYELNVAKKINLKNQICDLQDQLNLKTGRDPRVDKIMGKICDELTLLPSQVSMSQYSIFNQKTTEFINFSNQIFNDYAAGALDSDLKIEEFSHRADVLIRVFSGFKNNK